MKPEDEQFVKSLNCYENNYDVLVDNISKLSGMLGLQIKLLQNIEEEKEHRENVRTHHPQVVKALYKKRANINSYIKVAFIVGDGTIHFLARNEKVITDPTYYDSLWYYLNEVGELRYSTFDIPTWLTQTYVEDSVDSGEYYVTGYLTEDGREIYYDQYL